MLNINIRNVSLFAFGVSLFFFFYGLVFFFNGSLDGYSSLNGLGEWIPYDSKHYVELSEVMSSVNIDYLDVLTGSLNWLSIPYLYRVFTLTHFSGALGFLIVNSFCLYCIAKYSITQVGSPSIFTNTYLTCYYGLFILCSPYLFAWILVPNKELIYAAGILLSILFLRKRAYFRLVALFLIVGTVKIQFALGLTLYFLFSRFKFRAIWMLLTLSLVFPLIHSKVPGLQMSDFLEVNPNEIRTAGLFLFIDHFSDFPFGFLIALILRAILNIFGGINPIRIFESGFELTSLAPLSSFFLGLVSLLYVTKFRFRFSVRRFLFKIDGIGFYFLCIFVVNLAVPFLQPRYYWWIMPILLRFVVSVGNDTTFQNPDLGTFQYNRHINAI